MKLFLFVLMISQNVFAWGPKGQEITVQIAEKFLTPKAAAQILKISQNRKLSSFSSWADQVRGSQEWKETGPWHYINVDDSGNYQHEAETSPKDILDAIKISREKIQSNLPDEQKLVWLKFLVHFIGDIHQPMHVGREADRGGNSTTVTYKRTVNLHFLWDSAILDSRNLDIPGYINLLTSQNRPTDLIKQDFDPRTVVKENYELRKFIYSFKDGKISSQYEKQGLEIIDDRLWVGGLRLAQVLNSLFM